MDARSLAWTGTALMLALALPALGALLLDERSLWGVSVWSKPLKFDASLAVHLLTMGLLIHLLPDSRQRSSWLRAAVLVGVFSALAEALYITLQAARGRHSHFNFETPLESFAYYGGMGTGAVLLVLSSFAVGLAIARHADPSTPAGLRLGATLGLMGGSIATLLVASVLSAGVLSGAGHWVGGVRTDASGLPLLGWSTTGGDLRVPHFVATHLMQALPLAGWLADRLDPRRARGWVLLTTVLGLLAVVASFWQAASGKALWPSG